LTLLLIRFVIAHNHKNH